MPRTKKTEVVEEELSPQQVWSVIEFAKNLATGVYPQIFTPELLSSRMKENSFTPVEATEESLSNALKNPKESEQQLRSFIENFEIVSMPLKRILSYMASQLAFDLTYTCKNAESKDYASPKYKKDQKLLYEFLDKFDYKYQFKNVLKQLLRNDMFVCAVRDVGDRIVLQELPIQRCRINSKWSHGYLVSFDFAYFLQAGVDIRQYPNFFIEKFNEIFNGETKPYVPALDVMGRGDTNFAYWVDLPPDVGWVFKFDPSLATSIPYFSGLMPDLIQQPVMRSLQKDINMAAASKILVGAVPMLKDTKAKVSDMIAIDPTTLGKFLALVKSSLSSAIKVAAAPLEGISPISFDAENELYDEYLRTALASSGMNSALFYTSKLKANAIESQLSFESDHLIMEILYGQFNGFMDYWCEKYTKSYKFAFEFEGNSYYLDRKQRFDYAMQLANVGIILPQKIAAARGMKPQTLYRMLEESKAIKFTDMLTPIVPAFQQPAGADGKGRPQKDDGELSESGEATRSQGNNLERGGEV